FTIVASTLLMSGRMPCRPFLIEATRHKLCRVIDALLDDGPVSLRLQNAVGRFQEIDQLAIPSLVRDELSDILCSLSETISEGRPTSMMVMLTDEQEMQLTERLFSLYIDISGG